MHGSVCNGNASAFIQNQDAIIHRIENTCLKSKCRFQIAPCSDIAQPYRDSDQRIAIKHRRRALLVVTHRPTTTTPFCVELCRLTTAYARADRSIEVAVIALRNDVREQFSNRGSRLDAKCSIGKLDPEIAVH